VTASRYFPARQRLTSSWATAAVEAGARKVPQRWQKASPCGSPIDPSNAEKLARYGGLSSRQKARQLELAGRYWGPPGCAGNVCATGCEGHEHGGHGYLFCTTPLSWSAAEAACETQGFKLVRVDDATEMLWLHDICFAAVGSNNTAAVWPWLGANDQAVAGEWRWADGTLFWQGNQTGTPVAGLYNNWTQGEPIAKDSCGAMQNNPDKSLWAAQPCTSLHPYTCESP